MSAYTLNYDANGNLITGDGKFRIYDGFNHLVQVRNGSDSSGLIMENYTWHPMEDRILVKAVYETNGSWKENVYYFSKEFVRVKNATGKFDYKYIYQNGQLVAQQNPDGSKLFFHNDHLGSVGLITNESGAKVEETMYAPFGEIVSGGATSRFDYTGKEFDSVTGDYDLHARKYNPERITLDTPDNNIPEIYNPQSLNRYSYVKNNPYAYTDPNGKAAIWIHGIDTYFDYRLAGFSSSEAKIVAANAMEPDLVRNKESRLNQYWAKAFNLDLDTEVEGAEAEPYYHEGKNIEGNKVDLESDYRQAVKERDLKKMGNLEHALGHDVGSGGIPGYHTTAAFQNAFNFPVGGSTIKPVHWANDVFGFLTSRTALNAAQYGRAKEALATMGGGGSAKNTPKIIEYSYERINYKGGFKWTERIVTRR